MIVIIMAGGLGKRMGSDLPKVLHEVCVPKQFVSEQIKLSNKYYPMLIHVILTSIKLNPKKIFIIVGKFKDQIEQTVNKYIELGLIANLDLIEYICQEPALGTGHAIKCTLPWIYKYPDERTLILSGDVPLISLETLNNLDGQTNKLLITKLDNPNGCGRIIFDEYNNFIKIIEEKDCLEEEKLIKYVNCGIYQINVNNLIQLIPLINNNNKSQEYYLTDIIGLMIDNNIKIDTYELELESQYQIKNVNTKKDLEELNNYIKNMII